MATRLRRVHLRASQGQVGDLAGGAVGTPVQLPVDDEPHANASTYGHHAEVTQVTTVPEVALS